MPRELYTALEREVLNEKSENDEGLAALLADDGMECDDSDEEGGMDDAALMLLYDAQRSRETALQKFDYGAEVRGQPKLTSLHEVAQWSDWKCKGEHRFKHTHIELLMNLIEWPEDGYIRRGTHKYNPLEAFLMTAEVLGSPAPLYKVGEAARYLQARL